MTATKQRRIERLRGQHGDRACEGNALCPTIATYVLVLESDERRPYGLVLCAQHRKQLEYRSRCPDGDLDLDFDFSRIGRGSMILGGQKFAEIGWPPDDDVSGTVARARVLFEVTDPYDRYACRSTITTAMARRRVEILSP